MSTILSQPPNRSRPYLSELLKQIIEKDNPKLSAETLQGSFRPLSTQIAQFEMQLRKAGLLAPEETVSGDCIEVIVGSIAR